MSYAKTILAIKKPESLSLEEQVRRKVLPDELSINDIVSLITIDDEERINLKEILVNAVIGGELRINNPYVARACIRPAKLGARWFLNANYEDIIRNLEPFEMVCDKAMIGIAAIHKNTFKKYIDTNNMYSEDCILNNWFDESDNKTDIKQSGTGIIHNDIKTSKYKKRDDGFKTWISEKKPNLEAMTKLDIQNELIKINPQLWASGFVDWWKQQSIYKASAGRKKQLIE